jgi:hypothetical protein
MMTGTSDYRTAFPDFAADAMPAIPQGFEDASWHNDACPRFVSDALGLTLWIDYADRAQREHASGERFQLVPTDDNDDLRDGVVTDDWSAIVEAIEDERSAFAECLAALEKADGAILHWQVPDELARHFKVMHRRGLLQLDGSSDCYVHPNARKISSAAYTMHAAPEMRVLYVSDGEPATIMPLETLVKNFNASRTRVIEEDLRHELAERGWFEGTHEFGRFLIVNLDRMQLEPHPDHPRNHLYGAKGTA